LQNRSYTHRPGLDAHQAAEALFKPRQACLEAPVQGIADALVDWPHRHVLHRIGSQDRFEIFGPCGVLELQSHAVGGRLEFLVAGDQPHPL
jgi:hypothetical protein